MAPFTTGPGDWVMTPPGWKPDRITVKKIDYTPLDVHNARVSILESQLNQMERRLRMAETEARLARDREQKLLAYLFDAFNANVFTRTTLSRLRELLKESADGDNQETSEP